MRKAVMDKANKVAILGGKGMLGSDLAVQCQAQGLECQIYDLPEFDMTDVRQLQSIFEQCKTVVNCAAYTNVEKAESESELAYRINCEAVGQMGVLARKNDAWVLHISTDFVFDGEKKSPYIETDLANPINAYGMTKLAGERMLTESRCNCCILRLQWTYGKNGNNFVTKLLERARLNGELKVVDDQIGSPTATTEVANVICQLIESKPKGVFNFAADGYVSRYEMARFILDKLAMTVDLQKCVTSDFASAAKRPLNSKFDCRKLRRYLSLIIKPWQGPLEDFVKSL